MKETGEPGEDKPKDKSTMYIGLGAVFMFVLALTWSIDSSLGYISFGIATFFFFMGLQDRLRSRAKNVDFGNYSPGEPETESASSPSPMDELRDLFTQKQTHEHQTHQPKASFKPTGKNTAPKIVLGVFIIFGFIFSIGILVTLFSSEDQFDALSYFQMGEQFLYSNQYDSARTYYRKAVGLQPDYTDAWRGYGRSFLAQQQYDSALIIFDKVIALEPEDMEASYNKAQVYYNQKNYDLAVRQAEGILVTDPAYYNAMLLAGDCYYLQKQYDPALTWYEKAYSNNVRSTNLSWVIGYIHDQKGHKDEAITFYKETLSYDSSIVEVYARLGELLPAEEAGFYRAKAAELQPAN